MDFATLLHEVGAWPIADRLRLIEEIWDTIPEVPQAVDLSDSQRQDLQRRLDAFRDNPKAGAPWEEVEARLRRSSIPCR